MVKECMTMPDETGITLSIGEQPGVDAVRAATMLAQELTRAGARVSQSTRTPPRGTKSGLAGLGGSLVFGGALSAVTVRGIVQVILAFIRRGTVGEITVEDGSRKLTINNASRDTERILVDWLVQSAGTTEDEG
jgi:hypothetical protein